MTAHLFPFPVLICQHTTKLSFMGTQSPAADRHSHWWACWPDPPSKGCRFSLHPKQFGLPHPNSHSSLQNILLPAQHRNCSDIRLLCLRSHSFDIGLEATSRRWVERHCCCRSLCACCSLEGWKPWSVVSHQRSWCYVRVMLWKWGAGVELVASDRGVPLFAGATLPYVVVGSCSETP